MATKKFICSNIDCDECYSQTNKKIFSVDSSQDEPICEKCGEKLLPKPNGPWRWVLIALMGLCTLVVFAWLVSTLLFDHSKKTDKAEIALNTPERQPNNPDVHPLQKTPVVPPTIPATLPVKPTPVKPTPVKPTPVKPTPVKPEPVKPEPVKPEPVKPEPVKPEPVKPEPVKTEPVKTEPAPKDPNTSPLVTKNMPFIVDTSARVLGWPTGKTGCFIFEFSTCKCFDAANTTSFTLDDTAPLIKLDRDKILQIFKAQPNKKDFPQEVYLRCRACQSPNVVLENSIFINSCNYQIKSIK